MKRAGTDAKGCTAVILTRKPRQTHGNAPSRGFSVSGCKHSTHFVFVRCALSCGVVFSARRKKLSKSFQMWVILQSSEKTKGFVMVFVVISILNGHKNMECAFLKRDDAERWISNNAETWGWSGHDFFIVPFNVQ